MLTREPWLGDALRALRALAPDDDVTVRQILSMLSLPLAVAEAAPAAVILASPTRADVEESRGDVPPPPRAAAATVDKPSVAPDAGWRLPSGLAELPFAPGPTPLPSFASLPPLVLSPSHARLPPAMPLMPRQRRRAILTALLHDTVAEGEPDVATIVATLGRGRWLAQVPRRLRRTLRHGVELRPDRAVWLRAFHADQTELRDALTRLLPAGRVTSVPIDGAPEPRPGRRRAPARSAEAARSSAPTPILLLSDLGSGYRGEGEPPASLREWQTWFVRQRRAGQRSVVLTPLPVPLHSPIAATLMPWSEQATIGDAWRARAGQLPAPAEALGDDAMRALAQALSPALVISPALLRASRLALSLPPAAEAELLAHGPVASHGAGGTRFDAAAARELRAQLAQGERLEPALERVAAEGRQRQDGSAIEETLIALELRGRLDDAAAGRALGPALAALAKGGAAAASVADWAAHAWTRMSPRARATQAAGQLAFAAAREQLLAARRQGGAAATGWLAAADGADGAASGLPVLAPWLGGSGSGRLARSVELRRYADGSVNLVIGPEAEATQALHRIELPDAAPWVQVRFGERQAVLVLVGAAAGVETGADAVSFDVTGLDLSESIELAAADGRRWELTSRSVEEVLGESSFLLPEHGGVALCLAPGIAVAAQMPAATRGDPPPTAKNRAVPALRQQRVEGSEWSFDARDGTRMQVCVLAVLAQANGIERLALEFTPPHALRPFDRQAHGSAGDGLDLLVSIDINGDATSVPVRPIGHGYRAAFPRPERDTPLMLLDRVGRDWSWVERVGEGGLSAGPKLLGPAPNEGIDSIGLDVIDEWLAGSVRKRFSLWLVETRNFGEETAGYVHSALQRRWPEHNIEWLMPGIGGIAPAHIFAELQPGSDLRRALGRATARVLILGDGQLLEPMVGALMEVVGRGGTVVAMTSKAHDGRESWTSQVRESKWPQALIDAVMQRQLFAAMKSGDDMVEAVSAWLEGESGAADPTLVSAEPATPRPAPVTPQTDTPAAKRRPAGSLRQRLVAMIENREARDLGMFRIDVRHGLTLTPAHTLPTDRPLLLFMHGITGGTVENFGPLLADDPARAGWLAKNYGDAMYAWHYRSLSVGPLANALALLRALPPAARLHLVTYSAGGVIGELLCRGMRSDGSAPIDRRDLERVVRAGIHDPSFEDDQAEFSAELASRRLRIERFVRIAAPIEGSTIYGSGTRTTLKLARAVPWVGGIVAALPGVESLLTDPRVVPGAAALVPGAWAQALLTRDVRVTAPLSVIAGVHEAQSLPARASAWWAGLTGGADPDSAPSDLWVSLASALAGLERDTGIEYFIERGEQVDHAGYLRLASVRERVVAALLADGQPAPGFAYARSMQELKAQG